MKQVKVPTSIQEAFAEARALEHLASQLNSGWWFSPKALVYQLKADKIYTLSWRALKSAAPEVQPNWVYDPLTGTVSAPQAPDEPKVKKPRAKKAKPAAPTAEMPAV